MSFDRAKRLCGDLPWNQDDPRKLGQVISEFTERFDAYLAPWSQLWFENFSYIYGNQDVRWSKKWGFAVDVDFLSRRSTSLNTRSKTNVARVVYESLTSLIFGNAPDWDVIAADESSTQGRRFQYMIEALLDCQYERLSMEQELRSFTGNLTAFGMSAAKIDWCTSTGSIQEIPMMEEQDVSLYESYPQSLSALGLVDVILGSDNGSGQPLTERRLVPKRDEHGAVVTEKRWTGDVRITTLTPFEYRRELNPHGAHKSKWVQHIRIMDFDDYLKEYNALDGRTAYYDRVEPGMMHNSCYKFAIRQFMRMNFVTPMAPGDVRRLTYSSLKQDFLKNKVIVIEHYDRPDADKWATGRLSVVVNGYLTHQTKPQYSTRKTNGWHPFVEANWLTLSPSAMPSSPMNDIIAKNRELNILDSLIDTATLRNMGSMLLVKSGGGLDPQMLTGEPGQVFEVNDPSNTATWMRDPLPIPPIAPQLRDMKKDDIFEISGSRDAIRGDRSKGISSGYGQKVVEEREQARLTPVRRELERATGEMGQKIVACIKQCAPSLDELTFGYLKNSAAGKFSDKDIVAFLRTPIEYGVDINVKGGSMVAKSKAARQNDLMDVVTKTEAKNRLQDAGVLDNFLKEMGVEALRDASATHRDKSKRENEVFSDIGKMGPEATGIQIPVVCDEDDHAIHIAEHNRDYVEKFDDMQQDEFQLTIRKFHVEMHRIYQKEQAGEVPPGTAHNFRQMYNDAKKLPPKDANQVISEKQQQDQVKLQTQAQQSQAGGPGGAQGSAPGGQPGQPADQSQGGQQVPQRNAQAQGQVRRETGG